MSSYELVETPEQATAVIRLTVPRESIQEVMGPAVNEILATLSAQGLPPSGPMYSYHFARPTDVFDFEVGFPVTGPVTPMGRVKAGQLPAVRVARTVYRGDYEGLGSAWGAFIAQLEADKVAVVDSLWERYVVGPASGLTPSEWQTELNRPLAP